MNCLASAVRKLNSQLRIGALCAVIITLFGAPQSYAESVDAAWLRYTPIVDKEGRERYAHLPAAIVVLDDSSVATTASSELVRGVRQMLRRTLRVERSLPKESSIILGTFSAVQAAIPAISNLPELADDGFWLKSIELEGKSHLLVASPNERGLLYGAMFLLRKMGLAEPLTSLNEKQAPYAPLRTLSHADHLDGTVERGYAGRSIFWEAGQATKDLSRLVEYGRLMASVGINGCVINSSRVDARMMSKEMVDDAASIADVLRPWGVRVFVSIDLSSPQTLGGGPSFDPLDPAVAEFWERVIDDIYRSIPDLGGLVISPSSVGRVAPELNGRSHADAANVIAGPLAARGGVLLYVTSFQLVADWQNPDYDCARAAFDSFHALDGRFADNVILQTDFGPTAFQVREAPSPLIGSLHRTRQALRVSLAQELTGQQRHVCYLAPAWKAALEFKMPGEEGAAPVKQIVAGYGTSRPMGGFIAEAGVGRDANWLGHPLGVANLYAFGRLAWNPDLATKDIAEEWTRLTFGHDPTVVGTVVDLLMKSRRIYENYTGPLGAGAPTDRDGSAYGPAVAAPLVSRSDWRFADASGIGRDRTQATGSGFVSQYPPAISATFESIESCPDDLLLFMHHVPYTHVLKSGKTVIQHMYDAHYQGARDAARMVEKWRRLDGLVDEPRYREVLGRLEYQAGHAQVWRDAACNWLAQKSGVDDNERRVGKHTKRTEAEAMRLEGYEICQATPWESASGGEYVACTAPDQQGSASWRYKGKAGWMDISVWYFDENDGASQFQLFIGEQLVDEWSADLSLGDNEPNGSTATRHRTASVALRPGDELRIESIADGDEQACLDYVEVVPATDP